MEENRYRHGNHLMPPRGWLNDPNGSCYYDGNYHIFFQYSPEDPRGGGGKYWGHYVSPNLVDWEYRGIALSPDTPEDRNGVYSGTAYVDDGKMELFYTGNVKHEGDYDYILEGREANEIYVSSEDGYRFSEKKVLLRNGDYPYSCSCHVRDPKIWKRDETYCMLLGARTKDDRAAVLLYRSSDKQKWYLHRTYSSGGEMGYMFECPDYFLMGDQEVIGICPQGMDRQKDRLQNIYHSGYVIMEDGELLFGSDRQVETRLNLHHFFEWDMGFDFYAPQTFEAPDGRRLLIGWAGVPDAEYGNEPAIAEGWQHSMTIPREVTRDPKVAGKLRQVPIREFAQLRREELAWSLEHDLIETFAFDAEMTFDRTEDMSVQFNEDLVLKFKNNKFTMKFLNHTGEGRTIRRVKTRELRNLRIIMDHSILEVYGNDGEFVMTTRYYPTAEDGIHMGIRGQKSVSIWSLRDGVKYSD